KLFPGQAQEFLRVFHVFEDDEVKAVNRPTLESPDRQRFRVAYPFLAKWFVNRVPVFLLPFHISKRNPTSKAPGFFMLFSSAISIQCCGQSCNVFFPFQRPHILSNRNPKPDIFSALSQKIHIPGCDPPPIMFDPEAEFPAPSFDHFLKARHGSFMVEIRRSLRESTIDLADFPKTVFKRSDQGIERVVGPSVNYRRGVQLIYCDIFGVYLPV